MNLAATLAGLEKVIVAEPDRRAHEQLQQMRLAWGCRGRQ
jgi:hypothetical protein